MTAVAEEVLVPDIGDFTDVPIIEVLVSVGDTVAEEDPLLTLESDKATMDVPAPAAGVVQEIKVAVGDTVSQGSAILTLAPAGEPDQDQVQEAVSQPAAQEEAAVSGSTPPAPTSGAPPAAAAASSTGTDVPYASPAVRRLARERGVDLSKVTGSGRKGRIVAEDVTSFSEGGQSSAQGVPAPAKAPAAAAADGGFSVLAWPKLDFEKFGPTERQPLSRIKKLSGPNLHRNWVMIPHVTHNEEADITGLEAFRKEMNEAYSKQGVKFTMLAFVLKGLVSVLKEFPDFNSSLDGDDLILKRYYHLGFAADTPQGLMVPVIRDVDKKGVVAISEEMRELSGQARDGKLKVGDMQGGTFTVSSLGGIGGTSFTPIVNAPEVAILGLTRSAMKPVWNGSEFEPRLMQPLSLSYDHRVIDGAAAARFCASLAKVLTDMRRVLL